MPSASAGSASPQARACGKVCMAPLHSLHLCTVASFHCCIAVLLLHRSSHRCVRCVAHRVDAALCTFVAAVNDVFDVLPLAAVVSDAILCVHAGIGAHWHSLSQVRPGWTLSTHVVL